MKNTRIEDILGRSTKIHGPETDFSYNLIISFKRKISLTNFRKKLRIYGLIMEKREDPKYYLIYSRGGPNGGEGRWLIQEYRWKLEEIKQKQEKFKYQSSH